MRLQMNTAIPMKVYDYLTQSEKEMKMSPLDSIKFHRKHMQMGSLAVEPHTGEIKSWVGGVNFKYFKYDHVNSRRQVGSTFKPFVYASAIALQKYHRAMNFKTSNIQYQPMILTLDYPSHGHQETRKRLYWKILQFI